MTAQLEVISAGPMTSVQDLGRFGSQALGVPTSGALDVVSLRIANALVGNPDTVAAFEFRFLGPQVRVIGGSVRVALYGARTGIEIVHPEPRFIPVGQSATLQPGEVFRIAKIADSACCYLAVSGGLDVPSVLGSASTYAPASLGGYQGRSLRDGDILPLVASAAPPAAERVLTRDLPLSRSGAIRVVPGPQDHYFSTDAWQMFLSADYEVSSLSNRMALRLEGPSLAHEHGFNIPSDGIVTGSIQVPGDGLPIVLLADRQTTGGYPKIATVISADVPRLGRMLPGQRFGFSVVEVETAETLRHKQEAMIQKALASIEELSNAADLLNERLMRSNLISGVTPG